jgi:hypothetical protein
MAEFFYEGTIHSDLAQKMTTDGVRVVDLWKEVSTLTALIRKRQLIVEQFMGFVTNKPDGDKVTQATAKWMRRAEHGKADQRTRLKRDITVTVGLEAFESYLGWTRDAEILILDSSGIRAEINAVVEANELFKYNMLFRRVFDNTSFFIVDELSRLRVPQLPFYNGDLTEETKPPRNGYKTFDVDHDHFMRTATEDVITAADLDAFWLNLSEHGYTENVVFLTTENTAQLMMEVGSPVVTEFFERDPDIPDDVVNINQEGILVPVAIPVNALWQQVGSYRGRAKICVTDQMPDGYIFGFSHQGVRSRANPLIIRVPNIAALVGMHVHNDPVFPFINVHFDEYYGAGIGQRGNGVVLQVSNWDGGSYNPPEWDDDEWDGEGV